MRIAGGPVHVGVHQVTSEAGPVGDLVLLHDLSFIDRRSQDTRKYLIVLIAVLGAVDRPDHGRRRPAELARLGFGARALLRGEGLLRPDRGRAPELAPFAADLRERLRDLEDEYRRIARARGRVERRPAALAAAARSCAATR